MIEQESNEQLSIEDQFRLIVNRLEAIDKGIRKGGTCPAGDYGSEDLHYCELPPMPERELETGIHPFRARIIRSIEKKWVNGTRLKYYFFENEAWGGIEEDKQVVREAFQEWMDVGIGIHFNEVSSRNDADIRIGFERNAGSWSYIGRDIWSISQSDRTMNFGWRLSGQSGTDTALHEIGHTLGFFHEHQNPNAGIVWDEEEVYDYFSGPPNFWSREKTFSNVIRTLDPNSVDGTDWDPDSIMHYPFTRNLIRQPEAYRNGLRPEPGLSDTDRAQAKLFYPPLRAEPVALRAFKSELLQLRPAEQIDFVIQPQSTRTYTIQTFGASDVMMVLLEEDGDQQHYMSADDDSGWSRNASLQQRLVRGRTYTLRLRMYSSYERDETAIMLW